MNIEQKISKYLQRDFKYEKPFADKSARKIALILIGHNDRWIDVSTTLPEPQPFTQTGNDYYLVKTEHFGQQKAMYCIDTNGEIGWYTSYVTKLVVPVLAFMPII